ncbi:replication protein A 32 kDa subunit A-like isoform X2 [Malania oleifera]|uniref:replication protein A 32 kDa subunit A-like isoform X2 n=1 Tax=Malania oleifera TaxID=397392 RepID=UPI0025AE050D|nr:replication protein A 32 kDa subunit A-like isoform X2 [Malania oleifera]
MLSSQFDGSAAFFGGGFTSSQLTQASDSSPSSAKSRESHGIRPVTVKQISGASQSGGDKSNFLIDGVDVANVTVIGLVSDKSERVTDVDFSLDDGTGRIFCKRWCNETFDKKEMEDIHDGMYVRVVGHLNSFQGQRQVAAFSVRPVTNFDEVTFHFIQCIHVHLQNSKLKLQGESSSHPVEINPSLPSSLGSNGYQPSQSNQFSEELSIEGFAAFDQTVLNYLRQSSNAGQETGIHRDELSRQLKVPLEKIMYSSLSLSDCGCVRARALEKNLSSIQQNGKKGEWESIRTLESEGMVYSTIDELHYKST